MLTCKINNSLKCTRIKIGFSDVDELDDRSLRDRYRQKVHQQMEELMQREEDLKQKFVRKIRDKEAEFKEAEMKVGENNQMQHHQWAL